VFCFFSVALLLCFIRLHSLFVLPS
jgi:hypothetical protein